MCHGAVFIPWKSFSHYEVGPEDGLISLYSSYSPTLRTWVLNPPAQAFTGVLAIIQKNLPSRPPAEGSIPWQRSSSMLLLDTSLLVILPLLPAFWGLLRGQSWVWIYSLAVYFVVQSFGIKLFTLFDGRQEVSLTERTEN
jgi:hypothetical protein